MRRLKLDESLAKTTLWHDPVSRRAKRAPPNSAYYPLSPPPRQVATDAGGEGRVWTVSCKARQGEARRGEARQGNLQGKARPGSGKVSWEG